MTRAPRVTCAALLAPLLTLTTACDPTLMLAPPPLPPAFVPVVADDAAVTPVAGFTRVRVSTDIPARVYLHAGAVGGSGPRAVQTLVCETTPCAFIVPYADHQLVFAANGSTENAADERDGSPRTRAPRSCTRRGPSWW